MKRVYIHAQVYDAIRDELVELAKEVKIGNPFDPEVNLGPVANKTQAEFLRCVVPSLCLITEHI